MGRVPDGQVRQIYNSPYGRSTDGIPLAMPPALQRTHEIPEHGEWECGASVGDDVNASNSSCFSDCNSRCDINRSETSS
jgi:hypothetical protein